MNKSKLMLGKKVIAFILMLVVLMSSMPVNVVFAITDAITEETTETSIDNEEIGEEEAVSQEISNDAPNEPEKDPVIDQTTTETESTDVVEPKKEDDTTSSSDENDTGAISDVQKTDEVKENQDEKTDETKSPEKDDENNTKAEDEIDEDKTKQEETENDLVKEDETIVDSTVEESNTETNKDNLDQEQVDVSDNMVNQKNVSGTVIWKDNSNAYGTRPSAIKLNLFAGLNEEAMMEISVLPDALGNWNYVFENVDVTDENNNAIEYRVVPKGIENYNIVVDENNNITNTLIGICEIAGSRVWKDNNNLYNTRPTSVQIDLLANGNIINTANMTADELGNWNYLFTNLNKYDENGVEIAYQVVEHDVAGYTTSKDQNVSTSVLVGTTSVSGNITWNDSYNTFGTRPETVNVKLLKGNEKLPVITLCVGQNEADLWQYEFNSLNKYDENGVEIVYSVSIDDVNGYTTTIEKVNNTQINLVNSIEENVELDLTWREILDYGPYMIMLEEYAELYGGNLLPEEKYIAKKYKELIYEVGPELAATAMIMGTEVFTEEELAVYEAYQKLVFNNGEHESPIATLDINVQGGYYSKEILSVKRGDNQYLKYLSVNNNPVDNSIKYVASKDGAAPKKGDPTAYCMNYDRHYEQDADYNANAWDQKQKGTYGPVFKKLYSELSYLVSIGCQEYGGFNKTGYSTKDTLGNSANWQEDYYATQTAIYVVIYDYTHANTLKPILKTMNDYKGKTDAELTSLATAISAEIAKTFSGHTSSVTINTSETNNAYGSTQQNAVKKAYSKLYNEVKRFRGEIGDASDGYDGSITLKPEIQNLTYDKGQYKATVNVGTTGTLTSSVSLVGPAGMTSSSNGNEYTISIPASSMGDAEQCQITAKANFNLSNTVTYICTDSKSQNVAFFQKDNVKNTTKSATATVRIACGTVELSGEKTWKDDNNAEGKRPDSITIKLLQNGVVVDSKVVTAKDNWKWKFVGHPLHDNHRVNYTYTVLENDVPYYSENVNGMNVTNTISELTEVTVTKQWKDNENSYNTRPEKIVVNLLANNKVVKTQNITAKDGWEYKFTNLPKYDENGVKINYTVSEKDVKNYVTKIDGTTIVNTLTGKLDISGNKSWYDNNNAYNTRPNSIIVDLFANGKKVDDVEVSADKDGKWMFLFQNLRKYDDNGVLISYEIKENESIGKDYESKVNGTDLKNTLVGKTEVSVKKTWNDNNDAYETRPDEITVNLLANDALLKTEKLNEANNWTHKFENLQKYDELGVKIKYTIQEVSIPEMLQGKYVTNINLATDSTEDSIKYNIVNTLTDEIIVKGTKTWKDNNNGYETRPEFIVIRLQRYNGESWSNYSVEEVYPDANGKWTYSFAELPKYDYSGTKYEYRVQELPLEETDEGYYIPTYPETVETHEDITCDILNTLSGKTELGGDKVWKDNNNAYNTRPNSIIVNLLANGEKVRELEVSEGESGDWRFLFANLIKYDDEGVKIEYTIEENEVIDYVGKVEENTITNTLTGKTEVSGIKIWHDSDNDYETRPDSITVKLLANGEEIKEKQVTAGEDGQWKFTFEDLDEYDDEGVKIVYTVDEVPVPRYATDIKGTTIINTLIHTKLEEYDETPKTGRKNMLTFFSLTAMISIMGLVMLNKKDDNEF